MNKYKGHDLKEQTSDRYLGFTGSIWCLIAGLCYGVMNVFAKLAYDKGMTVNRFVFIRFFTLMIFSYLFGRFARKTSFNLCKYNKKVILLIFMRAALSLFSKVM